MGGSEKRGSGKANLGGCILARHAQMAQDLRSTGC